MSPALLSVLTYMHVVICVILVRGPSVRLCYCAMQRYDRRVIRSLCNKSVGKDSSAPSEVRRTCMACMSVFPSGLITVCCCSAPGLVTYSHSALNKLSIYYNGYGTHHCFHALPYDVRAAGEHSRCTRLAYLCQR